MRVDEHTIELAGSPAFYRRASGVHPPPLYLHGIPTSSGDWLPFLERTGGIAPDLIGFGRSGKGGHLDYSLGGLAEYLERLLEVLEVERVRLVGHDWGAAVGLLFAQRHPDRIERVVLLDPLPLLQGFRWPRLQRLWRRPLIGELLMGSTTKRLLTRELRRADTWPQDQLDAVWEQFDQGTQRAILRLHRSADEPTLAAAGGNLAAVRARCLVLWGERDPWLPVEFAERYTSALPNATAEQIPGAGHWPWLDHPQLIDRVAAFLQ